MAFKSPFQVLATLQVPPSKLRPALGGKFRGRQDASLTDEDYDAMEDSLRSEGQKSPLTVRQVPGTDEYEVIAGSTRAIAGAKIEKGYTKRNKNNEQKEVKAVPDFTLRCEVVNCTDEDAILSNVVEQKNRNDTTWVDEMENHQILRDTLKLSDAAITKKLGYASQNSVSNPRKIKEANLPQWVTDYGATRQMTLQAALYLARTDEVKEQDTDKRANFFDALYKKLGSHSNGHETPIGQSQMMEAIKAVKKDIADAAAPATPAEGETASSADGEASPATETPASGTPKVQLTVKQFKTAITALAGDERCPDKTKDVLTHVLLVVNGEIDAIALAKVIMNVTGETAKESTKKVEPSEEVKAMDAVPADQIPGAAKTKKGKPQPAAAAGK
jgi:hypothetical protein